MKKILLILLFVMPSIFVLADGPQYKFLSGNANKRISSLNDVYNVKVNTRANIHAGAARAIDYDNVNTIANPTGHSLVSSDITIGSEKHGSVSAASGIGINGHGIKVGRDNSGATTGTAFATALGSSKSGREITLGQNGHLALFGNTIDPTDGPGGNSNASGETPQTTPLGDVLLPLLMMILSFAGFVYFRKK